MGHSDSKHAGPASSAMASVVDRNIEALVARRQQEQRARRIQDRAADGQRKCWTGWQDAIPLSRSSGSSGQR